MAPGLDTQLRAATPRLHKLLSGSGAPLDERVDEALLTLHFGLPLSHQFARLRAILSPAGRDSIKRPLACVRRCGLKQSLMRGPKLGQHGLFLCGQPSGKELGHLADQRASGETDGRQLETHRG